MATAGNSPSPYRCLHRWFKRLLLAMVVLLLAAVAWDVASYDADAWLADYGRLKRDMAQGYANLDWIVEHRGLDLAKLDRETSRAIGSAHSRVRAFLAIRRFVKAFGDPHFKLEPGKRPITAANATPDPDPREGTAPAPDPVVGKDCASSGYEEGDHAFRFPFARAPGWTPLPQGNFPIGMIDDIGVLRIAQLGENRYASVCRQVFEPGIGQRALQLRVRAVLQRELAEAIQAMKEKGATRLLIDITGNGGGSEWVTDVIALMTDKPMFRQEARLAAPRCDRLGIWEGGMPCPVLGEPAERARLQGTGTWTGPVLVLADGSTASAAEDLAAWLKINGVAKLVGERTMGAGCGYIDGGTRTQFRASPFDARMPNCARFLDDGTNEIEGIAPDIAIPMRDSAAPEQIAALLAALGRP